MYKDDEPLNKPEDENCYEVYLNVFSGMPDPSWYLSSKESFEFDNLISGLPETDKRPEFPQLSYNGFTVIDNCITSVTVFGGVVQAEVGTIRKTETKYYEDVDGKVEKWLLSKAIQFKDLKDIIDYFNQ
jgi:hypothetical protein